MFIVHTRPVPGCCKVATEPLSILEVEAEKVTPMQDPSVMWMPSGEFKARILKPEFLYETQEIFKGSGVREKATVPSIYYSHSLYETKEAALEAATKLIVGGFQFEIRKGKRDSFSQEEVQARVAQIEEHLLK